MTAGVPVVVLSGVPGIGKTTTAEAMSDILRSHSVATRGSTAINSVWRSLASE